MESEEWRVKSREWVSGGFREQVRPGTRASRPHALPLRTAQFPWDAVPGHPAVGNGMGPAEAESWRHCRSSRAEEMGEALPVLCGRDARVPGWASACCAPASRPVYLALWSLVSLSDDPCGRAGGPAKYQSLKVRTNDGT